MLWLIAILTIIAAFVFPRFGKALLILVGLVVLSVVIILINNEREAKESRKRISPQEVQLTELRLGSEYGSYKLVGRIRNASAKYPIQSVQLRITLQDCIATDNCATIGDTTEYMFVSVPPGQTRAVDESVYFSDVPSLKGTFAWNYSIVEVSATK
jgi:hypothetical protein